MIFSRNQIAGWLIFILSTLVFCNLNGLVGLYLGVNAPFSPLILLLCFAVIAVSGIRIERFNIGIVLLTLFFLVFFANGVFVGMLEGYSRSVFKQYTREVLTSVIIIWTYYVYVRNLKSEASVSRFIQVVFGLFLFTSCIGIGESILGLKSAFRDADYERSLGFFGNPNETGLQCVFTFLLSCYLFIKQRVHPLLFLFAICVGVYGAVLSFSKAAMLLIAILFVFFISYSLFYLWRLNRTVARRFTLAIGALIGVIVLYVLPNFNSFYESISYSQRRRINLFWELVVNQEVSSETTSGRTEVQMEGLGLIMERPVFGYGMQSFSTSRLFVSDYGSHNTYLKIWGEGGLLALVLWGVFLLYMLIKGVFNSRFPDSYFIIGILLVLSIYFMVSHSVLSRKFVVPLLAIAVALICHKELPQGRSIER